MANNRIEITLSKTKIEALTANATGTCYYPITGYKGLNIQVTMAGTKAYVLRYRINGRQKIYTFGQFPDLTTDEVGDQHPIIYAKVRASIDPNQEKVAARQAAKAAKSKALTVSDFADRYITDHINVWNKDHWKKESTRLINTHIRPELGNTPLVDVGSSDISRLLDKLARKTPIQSNRVRAVLRCMFGRAEEWNLRQPGSNPVAVVRQKAPAVKRERRLSDIELKALGKALRESQESIFALAAIQLLGVNYFSPSTTITSHHR